MGFIDFTNGEVLTADQMDTVLRQSVMRFADATARDTALSAVLAEGLMCYLDDTNEVLKYDGSSWIDISGDITGVTAGTALTGGGTSGNVTLDVDETALTIAQSQVTDLTTDLAGKQDDVITTQGDLVIGDVSGNPVRLPVGSADQVLTSDGTTVSFQDAAGGGAGDWTEIVSAVSVGTGREFQLTGLSGYSDYVFLINNLEHNRSGAGDTISISDMNGSIGVTGEGALMEMDNRTDQFRTKIQPATSISISRTYEQADAFVSLFIQGAGSTAPALCEWIGGSNSNGTGDDETRIGKAIVTKNSQALDTITIRPGVGNLNNGTVTVYAR